MPHSSQISEPNTQHPMPVSVQILSTVLFAAFAIPVTIVTLNVFWPAGVLIAVLLAWRGGFAPTGRPAPAPSSVDEAVRSLMPTSAPQMHPSSSGNATFDAYRRDMMDRLETEQQNFGSFLTRLREAKDQSEFDTFLDAQAARTSEQKDLD